jgi:hypothetical protein
LAVCRMISLVPTPSAVNSTIARTTHVLGAVPIRDGFKTSTIGGFHIDGDPGAHPADSHDCDYTGILSRTLPSDFIH